MHHTSINRRHFLAASALLPLAGFAVAAEVPDNSASSSSPAAQNAEATSRIWDLSQLSASPKWTVADRPKTEGVQALFYDGLPFRGKPTRVFAWLGLPKTEPGRRVPGMVLIHGGRGTAYDEWVRLWTSRGYAAIAMDTCGCVPIGSESEWARLERGGPPGWGGWDQIDWAREDQWTYHAVADAILAHSLLRSLPEVDPERTGVTGISWGGYLTCILAGLDARFKLAVPVYGCGFIDETAFVGSLKALGPERAARWLEWWDPSRYLEKAAMPLLWVTGSNDFAFPLNALQKSYRVPKTPRTLCVRVRMPHGHGGPGENPHEILAFADSYFKAGAPLTRIVSQSRTGTDVQATFDTKVPVVKAELNYTRDNGRWQERKWESMPARLGADARITASLPEGTRCYYLNIVDERNCVVSTEHEELTT